MMKSHMRLQNLYNQLNDEDSEELAKRAVTLLTQEMELFCNFCGQRYGLQDDSLQALRCSHIFHERSFNIFYKHFYAALFFMKQFHFLKNMSLKHKIVIRKLEM